MGGTDSRFGSGCRARTNLRGGLVEELAPERVESTVLSEGVEDLALALASLARLANRRRVVVRHGAARCAPPANLNLARRYKSCPARYFSSSPRINYTRARLLRHGFGALRQRPLGRVAPKRHARDVGGTLRVCPPRACRFAPRGRASSRSSLGDRARDVRAPSSDGTPDFRSPPPAFRTRPRLARGAQPEPLREYLRLVELSDGSWELQSATATFRRPDGEPLEVSLAATVHVGDASYYQGLQDECESSYDCVLFELITAEENLKPGPWPTPTDPPGDHPSFAAASASSSSPRTSATRRSCRSWRRT